MMVFMKWNKIFKKELTSSMDEMRDLAQNLAQEGTVVCVEKQTSGRGRQGRGWISPEGGLYFSILLRPNWELKDVSKTTLLAAVAVCEAVREFSGVDAQVKWPNDILVDEKKIAGILTESEITGQKAEFVIVGIGLNVNTEDLKFLREVAVSLKQITGQEYDLEQVLDEILKRFEFWYDDVTQNGFEKMMDRWRALCGMLGQRVKAENAQGTIEGVAQDISDDGGLLIKKDDGEIVKVMSGDVVRVRENGET